MAGHQTPFQEAPLVNYQGNLYIGQDGARYKVTKFPYQIDPYGEVRTRIETWETSHLNVEKPKADAPFLARTIERYPEPLWSIVNEPDLDQRYMDESTGIKIMPRSQPTPKRGFQDDFKQPRALKDYINDFH